MSVAVVVFDNNQVKFVSPHKGAEIWRAKHGIKRWLNKNQKQFIGRVREVYLNDDIAPPDYKRDKAKRQVQPRTQLEFDAPEPWWNK